MKRNGTRLEIDFKALEHNYSYLRSLIKPETLFLSVVKANAYGHGIVAMAQKLQELGTDYFAVAYVEEGAMLRDNGIIKPILVLHAQEHTFKTCIDRCLEPVIYSLEMLERFSAFAKAEQQKNYPIHIEFNTGLNRIGLDLNQAEAAMVILKKDNILHLKGLQSHLAASEDPEEHDFTIQQITAFEVIIANFKKAFDHKIIIHESNTSGIFNYKNAHFSMVRSGIGLYGYGNDAVYDEKLIPVATMYSNISQIRTIAAGQSVSYNRKFTAKNELTYAVIALGHGDGYTRNFGHGVGKVLINGQFVPTLGIICMDMFMVDVTNLVCNVGDEVILFGPQIPANHVAENAGTISYELLTGMRSRVPVFYNN